MGARGHDPNDERFLVESRSRGRWPHLLAMARLSGPGWLQSAITLGGGSLASALYLGSLTGYGLLWVQVVAMLLGIVILRAVAEVTLLTGTGPYRAMVDRVNPVLGFAFIGAVLLANVVWCMPQFVLGVSALEHLLLPEFQGLGFRVLSSAGMLLAAVLSIVLYMRGDRGIRWYENILRVLVGVIVICFVGVVVSLRKHLPWDAIGRGFVPSLDLWLRPAEAYAPFLEGSPNEGFWTRHILKEQRSVLIAAAATAVGINMTFLLPYSMLRKGWNRNYRSLVTFDLLTALLIPFVLATGCVVVAAAASFHGRPVAALVESSAMVDTAEGRAYVHLLRSCGRESEDSAFRSASESPDDSDFLGHVPLRDRSLAAMLVRRGTADLSRSLEPFVGPKLSRIVFGVGVLAMALSTAMILMLISGFAVCEVLRTPPGGRTQFFGSLLPAVGVLGPFVWSGASFWLAVPTSIFGMVLLPIAAWSFFLMLNSRRLMGQHRPIGRRRWAWNLILGGAALILSPASLYSAWVQGGVYAIGAAALLIVAAAASHFYLYRRGEAR